MQVNLEEIKPDSIVITEHEMTEVKCLQIEDYVVVSHFNRSLFSGGSVLILAHTNIKSKINLSGCARDVGSTKSWALPIIDTFPPVLAPIYRTSNRYYSPPFLDKLEIIRVMLTSKLRNLIVTGDFNINLKKKVNVYI